MARTAAKKDATKAIENEVKKVVEITEDEFNKREEVDNIPEGSLVVDAAVVVDEVLTPVENGDTFIEKVAESITNTSTDIPVKDEDLEFQTFIDETLEPIKELNEKIEELKTEQNNFQDKLDASPEKAEEIIKSEIEKVEEIKNNVEKQLKNLSRKPDVTSWWNGMNFDF